MKVKMLPTWHVHVDNVAHGPGDVVAGRAGPRR